VRSIRNRLAFIFFLIVLTAFAVLYFYVVPPLESTLKGEKLDTLANASRIHGRPVERLILAEAPGPRLQQSVGAAAERSNARVTLLGVTRGTQGVSTDVRADSIAANQDEELQFQVAGRAVASGRTATGSEATRDGRLAQAARPLRVGEEIEAVLVFSQPLREVQGNVALIRRRIVVAGSIALVMALLAGYLVSRALSLRVARLERAARKVAGGDFSQPIRVDSEDELGQLAAAFNDMQRQLAQLDSARKRFIATASHELRTPIFSLGGFVELLRDEELDEETRTEFLRQVSMQIERLRKLATELLDLSRLEAGSLELRPERVDVDDLSRSVSAEFAPALAQHESKITVRQEGGPVEAVCDPERVAQILRILLDNALTHTPTGTPIEVTTARSNGTVSLAVRDRGLGIKRALLGRVFEPFYTSDDAQGAGLGLAIARDLAERMEGNLAVDSVSGSTTFRLELPA
jgi:two-component system, OmpR family, sensor kinase